MYRTYVTVRRNDDFVFPVDVRIRFDDGQIVDEHWDGQDRWKRFTYDRNSEVDSAEIDPAHQLWLDRNFYNNSYLEDADKRATKKLSNIWGFASQFLAQLLSWLA